MSLPTVAPVGAPAPSAGTQPLKPKFSELLPSHPAPAAPPVAAVGCESARPSPGLKAVQVVDQVAKAQVQLDSVLRLAQSGKTFTPAELLALQAQVCRVSQELDLAGKVVEKATSGVKQVLQTQV